MVMRVTNENNNDRPRIVHTPSDAGEALVIFDTGLMQDPAKVMGRIAGNVVHLGPSYYARLSSNDAANKEAMLKIVNEHRGRTIINLSTSKGGKDRVRMMTDPQFMAEHGPVGLMSQDSVPYSKDHIRTAGRWMLRAGRLVPDVPFADEAYALVQRGKQRKIGDTFVRGTEASDFDEVRTDMGILLSSPPNEQAVRQGLSEVNVDRIISVSAYNDRMVDTKRANKDLRRITGRYIPYLIDILRDEGDHAGVSDSPQFQVRQMEIYLAGDYDPLPPQNSLEEAA